MTNFATPTNLRELYARFLLEKRCLDGISGITLKWYEHGWKFFGIDSWPVFIDPTRPESVRLPEERAFCIHIQDRVALLASEGKPKGTINSYVVAINSFLNWAWSEKYLLEQAKIELLGNEGRLLAAFTIGHAKRLIRFVPQTINDARIRVMALLTLDCGVTLHEVLQLNKADIDYPNCLLRVRHGNRSRVVWMSPTMAYLLKKYDRTLARHLDPFIFGTRTLRQYSCRNAVRDLHNLLTKCRIQKCCWGSLRKANETIYALHQVGSEADSNRPSMLGHPKPSGSCITFLLQSFVGNEPRRKLGVAMRKVIHPQPSDRGDWDGCMCLICRRTQD